MINKLILLIILFAVVSGEMDREVKIFLAGDSTMSIKKESKRPETGWGEKLPFHFKDNVKIINHARNGRSTKTFIEEGLWQNILDSLSEGDYVIIQFGHNDESVKKVKRYTPPEAYRKNLIKFINDVRSAGAIPVLATPVVRRRYDKNGVFYDTHGVYPGIVKEVASAEKAALLDMHAKSQELLENIGKDNSVKLFLHVKPGQNSNYPDGVEDNTHFSPYGAEIMAGLAVECLKDIHHPLTAYLRNIPRDTSYNLNSAAQKIRKSYPDADPVTLPESSNYETVSYVRYNNRELKLDLFKPLTAAVPYPAVILIHGGGWASGNRSLMHPLAAQLAGQGFLAAAVEYRLSPEAAYPAALYDVKNAVKWLRSNADIYSIDISKIAVLGCSAGGHLAALAGATNCNRNFEDTTCLPDYSSRVNAVVDIDGVLDLTDPAESGKDTDPSKPSAGKRWLGCSYAENPDLWAEVSPVSHVNENSAPILFINSSVPRFHAGRDEMIAKMDKFGINSSIHTISGSPHTFWLFDWWFPETVDHTVKFLKRDFAGQDSCDKSNKK